MSMRLLGCFGTAMNLFIRTEFVVGDIVYLKDKAQQGVLEKASIKKVLLNGPNHIPMYKDTMNSIYQEDELLTAQEAIDSAISYYERHIRQEELLLARACRSS